MNLGNIFQPKNQNIKSTSTGKSINTSSAERAARVQSEIRGYTPGQKVQGEIVGKDGNTVQIAIDKDMVIVARLERDLNIALGQNMSFEVKSNSGSQLSLMPLYANMAQEATILKALSAAGLSQTAENIHMVSSMMQEGMAIDRETIAMVNRQLADFPQANPESIIRMIRLGLPINEISLQQFEQYQNNQHQILQSIDTIMEQLPQIGMSLLEGGQDSQSAVFLKQLLQIFSGDSAAQTANGSALQQGENAVLPDGENAAGQITNQSLQANEAQMALTEGGMAEADKALQGETVKFIMTEEGMSAQTNPEEALQQSAKDILEQAVKEASAHTGNNSMALGDLLKELGAEEKLVSMLKSGQFDSKELLTNLKTFLDGGLEGMSKENTRQLLQELFGNKTFQNALKSEIANKWLLNPEEVANKEQVEQLYERIKEQTTRLNETFQMIGKADTVAARSVQNLQNNVDFMNQMNQLFAYVQLPLKMAGNQAHGDLYVYTNKKNLAQKDGNVSALLHLDMEHLGALDVYVTMQQSKVSTNFTVQDDSVLDLLAAHIHVLNERLEKRGYSMNVNFQVKEEGEKTNVMQEILAQNKNISVLSSTSFDMRA